MRSVPAVAAVNPCEAARTILCPQCWAQRGRHCTISGLPGDHLARYMRVEQDGLITRAALAEVVAGHGVIAGHVIVPEIAGRIAGLLLEGAA